MLYPYESSTRETKDLNGIWKFRLDNGSILMPDGTVNKLEHTIPMPVPASYNDITEDGKIKHHVGYVWYERDFHVSPNWQDRRTMLRFGGVTHSASVWVNGQAVMEHQGGYTPFETDISDFVHWDGTNRITVRVSNILDMTTIPIGELDIKHGDIGYPEGFAHMKYYFDFFNYSGIHRPVKLYSTPREYIRDVTVVTELDDNQAIVSYRADTAGGYGIKVEVLDQDHRLVAEGDSGKAVIDNPILWEPGKGYLYTLRLKLLDDTGALKDTYDQPFGVRTVEVRGKQFLINGKPFYFKGFGKHEDFHIHGRGLNEALNVKDFSLLKWIGANSFRTSHYPYSEEIMQLADQEGIVVIDETPAVGMHFGLGGFDPRAKPRNVWETVQCQDNHRKAIEELIRRDKNHPCVVMWCIANEPASEQPGAYEYFKPLAELTKQLDPTRPMTIVNVMTATPDTCQIQSLVDVVCLNRYYGWYTQPGHLEAVPGYLRSELQAWWNKTNKPVMMTEYGADTIAGLTSTIPTLWTEDYQCNFLRTYHSEFDKCDFFIGEHVWNFADFATSQGILRADGNKKGVFTRERRPKKAAFELKERWTSLPDFHYKG
ncbi:MAG: beta-glucuronidase [Paenibacillus sp.]|jgi:beta-glucuronidase|nr:beta-glucuronidase [Paenibacillus sp.]